LGIRLDAPVGGTPLHFTVADRHGRNGEPPPKREDEEGVRAAVYAPRLPAAAATRAVFRPTRNRWLPVSMGICPPDAKRGPKSSPQLRASSPERRTTRSSSHGKRRAGEISTTARAAAHAISTRPATIQAMRWRSAWPALKLASNCAG